VVVGALRFVLQIPGAASLKDKRQVLRKVVDRIRARFNVSVAEVGDNDVWQTAVVGVAAVGNERAFVNEVLDKVLHSVVEGVPECVVTSHELELLTVSGMYGRGGGLTPERTLAEAEAGLTLEELEEAAERLHRQHEEAPPPARPRRRR
jgi:uncharacterized protein